MDWNTGDDSLNFTNNSEDCAYVSLLGRIGTWNLTVYLFITIIAAIANVLLLLAIYKNPLKCFRNPTTYFIANLAVVDLLNALFHFEALLVWQTKYVSVYCLPGAWETINSGFGEFAYFLTFPSVAVLALERYVSIAHPLWHQVNVTSRLCYTWIAIVWFVNCIFTVILNLVKSDTPNLLTAYPSIFYLTTVIVYLLAFISIRKQRFSLLTDSTKSDCTKRLMKLRLRNQNRFLTTVFIINVVLIFGIIPTVIGTHLSYTLEGDEEGSGSLQEETVNSSLDVLSFITDILFLLNMAVNPFLYIWRLPKYRKTFLVMYCCKK